MIHVLGPGAVGLLHAHHLNIARIPVTLIPRHPQALSRIQITINGQTSECLAGHDNSEIKHLLVCTKAFDTLPAMQAIKHRFRDTQVILLQNGVLQVHRHLQNMPNIKLLVASTTHGITRKSRYDMHHVGVGATIVGSLESCRSPILDTLQNAWRDLNCEILNGNKLRRMLLLKLVVNACLNPLTAILDCKNGGLDNLTGSSIFRMLLREMMPVVAELEMSEDQILQVVQQVTNRTRLNQNSMNRDMHASGKTELDYITGYLLERARELGVSMPMNELVYHLVKQKSMLSTNSMQ